MFDPRNLLRTHLKSLIPYSSARDDYSGSEGVFLDANENPYGSITEQDWNRYPDPYQIDLKKRIAEVKGSRWNNLFLGNGSDEPIDLLFRAFCEPREDQVIINAPTYGMYQVSAGINGVGINEVLLTEEFGLDVEAILSSIEKKTKMIFICSPNNPTGNDLDPGDIEKIIQAFEGIVVLDEAYIDFTTRNSFIHRLGDYANLVVLQTFSKAWGLASLRLGMAFASEEIVRILNLIKPPYNISGLTQRTILDALSHVDKKDQMVAATLQERKYLEKELTCLDQVEKVYPSDANFFLVKMKQNAKGLFNQLIEKKIIVRDRSNVVLCDQGLRITVGTKDENDQLINTLKDLK
jgi:histidinol-phosphate aminotransferase